MINASLISKLNIFNSKSIKRSLIVSIAAVHALLMSIFIYDLVQKEQEFLLEQSSASTTGVTRTLAINSINWFLSHDLVGLEEILSAQAQQPNFNFAMIIDTKGQVFAYHNAHEAKNGYTGKYIATDALTSPKSPADIVTFSDNLHTIDIAAPIFANETHIGWARVQMSRTQISDSLLSITVKGLLYTLLAILVGTLFAWIIGRQLTHGIYQLINATQLIGSGQRDIQIKLNRRDELQDLANNFQAMLTELVNKETELFDEKERAETTLKSIGDGVITTDRHGKITYLNPVSELLTGWSNHAACGQPIQKIFRIYHEQSMEPAVNPALKAMETGKIMALANHTVLINHADEKISIEDSGAPIIDKSGQTIGSVLVFHDASEARKLRAKLTWQATHDSLTGLNNRPAFESKLELAIEETAIDPEKNHCLLYIDLDQFKLINDTEGHTAGDELLKQISLLLKQQIRDLDSLARIGGDEFTILLEKCHLDDALKIAEKIRTKVSEYRFIWNEKVFHIGTSIGITEIHGLTNKATVMSQADIACYLSKDNGRNRISVYRNDDESIEKTQSQFNWVDRVKHAIEHKQFLLYAQELTPLQTPHTLKAYEILVRLKTPDGTIITPDQFLPAAERFNLMGMLDAYIVEQAIAWLKKHDQFVERLNINISGQSLDNSDFNDKLLELLKEDEKINRKLCFEITETTAITHMSASISFLNSIKNHGCQLALDDFGSGFSSFSWLKTLPVDFVKIDGTFILDVLTDQVDAAMVKALHQVSQEMQIQTVAEFVENQATSDWLQSIGIDFAQGYHFHKPTLIDDLDLS